MEKISPVQHSCCMKFSIREKRKAAGLTQEHMAEMLDISTGLYNGLETGKRRMNETYLDGIAKILGVVVTDLIIEDRPAVAVPGHAGAGAEVFLCDDHAKGDGLYHVACPPQLSPHGIVAVEVKGDSMEPTYSEGDLLFYSRETANGVPTEAIGKKVIAETTDGRVWVKQLKLGTEPGLFHLLSLNPAGLNMHDVAVKWAAPVRLHLPREFVKKV